MTSNQVWEKLGKIQFSHPDFLLGKFSGAMCPTIQSIKESEVQVLFSSRDLDGRGSIFRLSLNLENFEAQMNAEGPILGPGETGHFDDDGVTPSCLVNLDGDLFLYYVGWNRGVSVPFRNAIGLAQLHKVGTASKVFPGPLMDRTAREPNFVASCYVMPVGNQFRMWYLSCVDWVDTDQGPKHRYLIRNAVSNNGKDWERDGSVAIGFKDSSEYAISRPWVLHENGVFKMWFSSRGDSYRIGYAESLNGTDWVREDGLFGLEPSEEGWDSEMVEYPCVFDAVGSRWMLYNGNGYGRSGFGLARLKSASL